MSILIYVAWGFGLWVVVQLIRLIFADCDLTLQWAAKFGRKPAKLIGKVVWITGASGGIGESIAYEFAKAGCKLVLSARRRKELERVKAECLLRGPISDKDVLVLPLDIVDYQSHEQAVQSVITHFGKIDILVNNAGKSQTAKCQDIHIDLDKDIFAVNVFGTLSLTRAVLPHMMKQKSGQIAVVSSLAGKFGFPYVSTYNASKHALHGYFESMRCELNSSNISITMLLPGPVVSNLIGNAVGSEPGVKASIEINPEGKMSSERCAFLSVAAITNELDEVWITQRPSLQFMYFIQYTPVLARRLLKAYGASMVPDVK